MLKGAAYQRSACLRGLPGGEHRRDVVAQQREIGAVDAERSRRLLWVKSCPDGLEMRLPPYTRKRIQLGHRCRSVQCQQQTHAMQQSLKRFKRTKYDQTDRTDRFSKFSLPSGHL